MAGLGRPGRPGRQGSHAVPEPDADDKEMQRMIQSLMTVSPEDAVNGVLARIDAWNVELV